MQNNINTSDINNRKIIIEIRFEANPTIFDVRGKIIEEIKASKLFFITHWGMNDTGIKIFDNEKDDEAHNVIIVEMNRFLFVSSKINSIDNYYSKFLKLYTIAKNNLGLINAIRIGCRIIGTYKTKTNCFKTIFEGFKSKFPADILLKDYPSKDLKFTLEYDNGRYEIGPIKKDDQFINQHFQNTDKSFAEGIGIDNDNFIICSGVISDNQIKDVFIASLAVEKSLFYKLKDL